MQPTRADPRLDTATAGYGRTVAVVYRFPDCDGDIGDEVEADNAVFTGGYRRSDAAVQVRLRDPDAPGEAGVDVTVHVAGAPFRRGWCSSTPAPDMMRVTGPNPGSTTRPTPGCPAAADLVRTFYDAGMRTGHVR